MAKAAAKKKKQSKKSVLILGLIVIFLLIIYIAGVILYQNKFLPNTYINDRKVSGEKVRSVERDFENGAKEYVLSIFDENDNKEDILGSEIGLVYDIGSSIRDLKKKQNSFLWPVLLVQEKNYDVAFSNTYSKEQLDERVRNLQVLSPDKNVKPVDAKVEKVSGRYEITEGSVGYEADAQKVKESIVEAIQSQESILHLSDYRTEIQPEVTAEDLTQEKTEKNELLDLVITYEFGKEKRELTGEQMKDWIAVDKSGNVTVDRQKAYDFVYGLAKEFNTFGTDRDFTTTDGRKIVIHGGDYGWIINKEKETDALVKAIKEGKSVTREPIYEAKAATHDGVDTGEPNTYVEIDLGKQHLYYYENGVLKVESDIVSGTKGTRQTREGTFAVMFKKNNYTLVGETWNRPVGYFIAFYTDVGLHDATWRSSFGGNIYETNGSHGCINMPEDKVAAIFDTIKDGTIVYTYY